MNRYLEALIRLIYPSECGICMELLELEETSLCRTCKARLDTLRFPLQDASVSMKFAFLNEAWTLYPYRSPVKELISRIKFSGKSWLIRAFEPALKVSGGALLSEHGYDALVPVPLDSRKFRQREFNQSELIAKQIADKIPCRVETSWLKKRYATSAQGELTREERTLNLRNAFMPRKEEKINGKTILLVDDILTTGSTADEAARALKSAGAKRVDLLALARTELQRSRDMPVASFNPEENIREHVSAQ